MRQYVILIENGPENLSAYVPSLPGCITTGKTRDEVIANMVEAIQLHLEGMSEDGEVIPDEDLEAVTLVIPDLSEQISGESANGRPGGH
jgi:predicted RNase H-like HicB family nuclease